VPPQLGGTFPPARVVMDPVKLAELLRSEQGPVARRLIEDGQLVKTRAQELVGVYGTGRTGYLTGDDLARRIRQPGTLRDAIVARFVADAVTGFAVLVGAEDPIALMHHEGTQPHQIVPVRAPRLVFRGRDGTMVYALVVNHPGTGPNRYLVNALEVLGSRY
jgi:hypothetical protein